MTEEVRKSPSFKGLNVNNFRTKAAQALRDQRLSQKSIGFVHQASRYRGKANYREALFLAYGENTETTLQAFISDLSTVHKAFLTMAGAFASRKLGKTIWDEFIADVDAKCAFSSNTTVVWR